MQVSVFVPSPRELLYFFNFQVLLKNYFKYCLFISEVNTAMSLSQGMTSKIIFILGCFACMHVYLPTEVREGFRSFGNEVTDSRGCWEQNPDPLQEQPMLLTPELSLQPTGNEFLKILNSQAKTKFGSHLFHLDRAGETGSVNLGGLSSKAGGISGRLLSRNRF